MAGGTAQPRVGTLVREWRERRRMTQLDLALEAGISTRHLSFVETGRSRPGRALLLSVAEELDIPLRDRNRILLAAGHAPEFPERALDDPDLAPVREAMQLILDHHDPYPAIVVDRHWNVVATNAAMASLVAFADIDPALLEPPANAMRVGLHPRGLLPHLVDPHAWFAYFRDRLERQAAATGDPQLAALLEEVDGFRATLPLASAPIAVDREVLGPLRCRLPDGAELAFLGMFAGFGTPFEVNASELAIELAYPADVATREWCAAATGTRPRPGLQSGR